MSTSEFWAGNFGDEYLQRNRVDWRSRAPFWAGIMRETQAKSVVEFGCNAGHNLRAIRACSGAEVFGADVNKAALQEAQAFDVPTIRLDFTVPALVKPRADLAFTAGVLIHVEPADLAQAMENVAAASSRWVLAIEYAADAEEHVEYRGHAGKLWRRPFGRLYEEMGLTVHRWGDAGPGFDRCTYWLLEKA